MSTAIIPIEHSPQLANLERARQILAESRTLSEVKKIRDIAEAAKVYAKAAHLGRESQNYAAEISLLAARKAGEILKHLERDTPQQSGAKKAAASVAGPSEYAQTLKDTATPERTAEYWQAIAAIPTKTFQNYIHQTKEADSEVTMAGLIRAHTKRPPKPAPAAQQQPQQTPAEAVTAIMLFAEKLVLKMSTQDALSVYQQLSEELKKRIALKEAA
jgi:hypothetical protein